MRHVLVLVHKLPPKESGLLVKALDAANRAQSSFRLVLCADAPTVVEMPGGVDPLRSLKTLSGVTSTIVITSLPLLDNWFSHTEGVSSIITTSDWESYFAPPHIDCYLLLELAGALFIQTCNVHETALLPHEEDTGCLFDLIADKTAVRWKLRCGYVCGAHKDLYRKFGGSDREFVAIESLLQTVRRIAIGTDSYRAIRLQSVIDVLVVAALKEELQPFKHDPMG